MAASPLANNSPTPSQPTGPMKFLLVALVLSTAIALANPAAAVPAAHYSDADDRDRQLDYLSSRLYGGGGSHALFSKTVGAGLAYSNGLRGALSQGRVG